MINNFKRIRINQSIRRMKTYFQKRNHQRRASCHPWNRLHTWYRLTKETDRVRFSSLSSILLHKTRRLARCKYQSHRICQLSSILQIRSESWTRKIHRRTLICTPRVPSILSSTVLLPVFPTAFVLAVFKHHHTSSVSPPFLIQTSNVGASVWVHFFLSAIRKGRDVAACRRASLHHSRPN